MRHFQVPPALTRFALGGTVVAAFGLAACSSSSYSSSGSTTTTTAATATPAAAGDQKISTVSFAFQPQEVSIKVNAKVTWNSSDGIEHNVVDDGGAFNNGAIKSGTTFSHTYTTAGTFAFHCSIHPSMTGTVNVTA